jgi:hypothetical protein
MQIRVECVHDLHGFHSRPSHCRSPFPGPSHCRSPSPALVLPVPVPRLSPCRSPFPGSRPAGPRSPALALPVPVSRLSSCRSPFPGTQSLPLAGWYRPPRPDPVPKQYRTGQPAGESSPHWNRSATLLNEGRSAKFHGPRDNLSAAITVANRITTDSGILRTVDAIHKVSSQAAGE